MNPDCHYGDHEWRGASRCAHCGARLRCACGCYIREDNIENHLKRCPYYEALQAEDAAIARGMA